VSAEAPTRVFLLDDHEVVRRGVAELLGAEADLVVVGEASTAREALERIGPAHPDVALLDVRLPDGDGIEVCRDVRAQHPEIHCLMLTSFADDEALLGAVLAGASGYVLKQVRGSDLVGSIRQVALGRSLLDPGLVERARKRLADAEDPRLARLSPQERRILALIAEGKTNREIGEELFLAEKTVKNYVSNVLMKLDMKRRTEAAVFAVRATARRPAGPRTPD
jgi:DNA-binding NarL/FixJ family response regulator